MVSDHPSERRIKFFFLPLFKTHAEPLATLCFPTSKAYSWCYTFRTLLVLFVLLVLFMGYQVQCLLTLPVLLHSWVLYLFKSLAHYQLFPGFFCSSSGGGILSQGISPSSHFAARWIFHHIIFQNPALNSLRSKHWYGLAWVLESYAGPLKV